MLATCCTHCGTRFWVTSAQLQARSGQVRCGRCQQVFNALETLDARTAGTGTVPMDVADHPGQTQQDRIQQDQPQQDQPQPGYLSAGQQDFAAETAHDDLLGPVPDNAVAAPLPGGTAEAHDSEPGTGQVTPRTETADTAADLSASEATAVDQSVEAVTDAATEPMAGRTETAGDEAAVMAPADAARFADAQPPEKTAPSAPGYIGIAATSVPAHRSDAPVMDEDNPFAQGAAAALPVRRHHPLLAAGSVMLLLLVAAQGLYFYRSEIAARFPVTRDLLTKACEPLRCGVSLPRRPESVVIEASDLQATDASAPGRIRLTATLRNHATHVVAFPALDLVLTNANDHTLARRVFLPAEYLEPASTAATGLAPKAEATVRLTLDTGDLGAAGFRLAVLAAPLSQ